MQVAFNGVNSSILLLVSHDPFPTSSFTSKMQPCEICYVLIVVSCCSAHVCSALKVLKHSFCSKVSSFTGTKQQLTP